MDRRDFLNLSLAGSACLLMGHSPYGQWYRFRAGRLIIGTDRSEPHAVSLANAIAEFLGRHRPETRAMIATAPSSLDAIKLLRSGQVYVALVMADEAYEAYQGTGKFKGWAVPLRTVIVLDSHLLHLVTLEGSGIQSVADLKGKRVSMHAPGSCTDIKTRRVLQAYGIEPKKDVRIESLALSQAVQALKTGQIDALAHDAPIPNAAILDLATTPGVALKFLSHDHAIPKTRVKYGDIYDGGAIPKGTYPGANTDVAVASTAHLLVCREDLPHHRGYEIAQALTEHWDEWVSKIKGVHGRSSALVSRESPLPFHVGSLDYYQ